MAFSVQMPELGESVTEGTVTRWLKQEGDTVTLDEPLLEVSTDKVDTEIPSPAAGVLLKIVAEEDDTIDVGGELALIGEPSENSGATPTSEPDSQTEANTASTTPDQASEIPQEVPASPQIPPVTATEATPSAATPAAPGAATGNDVTMPELGESVTEGTVTRWLKQEGDTVTLDEPLLEVSTDKVDTEIPSPFAGTILSIVAQEDDTVEVGGVLAVIGDKDAAVSPPSASTPAPAANAPAPAAPPVEAVAPAPVAPVSVPPVPPTPAPTPATPAPPTPSTPAPSTPTAASPEVKPSSSGKTPYVTPLVRKLADKYGIDLSTVTGTGVGGRIRKQDVLQAVEAARSAPASSSETPPATPSTKVRKGVRPEYAALRGTTKKVNRIRQITAIKTRESLQQSAQLTQVFEADMTRIAHLRTASKQAFQTKYGINLTFLPFYAKAVVEALIAHPNVNASYDEPAKEITYYPHVNLGIAVDTEAGLLSPVIHNAESMTLPELAQAIVDIATRARDSKLAPQDLVGGTFTITNIGSQGALFDTPILVPPQAAMLGTGVIMRRPIAVSDSDGESIAIRQMSYLPLTYDHRLIDGSDAGRFLSTVKERLEEGDFTADLSL